MNNFLKITKALTDLNRIRILMALLANKELCVCQIIELLNLAPSTVSKHMFILKNAELVEGKKDGQWIYYKINSKLRLEAKYAIKWLIKSLSDEKLIKDDNKKLKSIMTKKTRTLCRKKRRMKK